MKESTLIGNPKYPLKTKFLLCLFFDFSSIQPVDCYLHKYRKYKKMYVVTDKAEKLFSAIIIFAKMIKMAGENDLSLNTNSSIEEICTKSNDAIDQDIFKDEFSLGAIFYLKDQISNELISSRIFHIQYLIDNLKTNIEYCISHYEDVNKKAGITYQKAFRNIYAINFRLFQEQSEYIRGKGNYLPDFVIYDSDRLQELFRTHRLLKF